MVNGCTGKFAEILSVRVVTGIEELYLFWINPDRFFDHTQM